MSSASTRAATRWITRSIPAILAGCVGFATYVVVKRICVNYFLRTKGWTATAIGLLIPYSILLVLIIATYTRLLFVIGFDPGVVPLGPDAPARKRRPAPRSDDVEAQPYVPGPDRDPDSPGLERFYTKEIFVCEPDGRPPYCSTCRTWKADRVHHSREINRCVRKMDHYCPWVGGIVSETSFKFFVQFTFYATLYCIICLVAAILCITQQVSDTRIDGTVIAIIALGAFFGLFTFGMTAGSLRYILENLTSVDALKQKGTVYQLAVLVPPGTPPDPSYGMVVYPLPKPGDPLEGRGGPESSRDRLATRTFAIVRTEMGENPWHLGPYGNWVSVMGTNIFDWLLPVRKSPCIYQENNTSFYQMGPLYDSLRSRYGLPKAPEDGVNGDLEMGELQR